jgi:hypothetical protein
MPVEGDSDANIIEDVSAAVGTKRTVTEDISTAAGTKRTMPTTVSD